MFAKYKINDNPRTDFSIYRHISAIKSQASYRMGKIDEFSQLFVSNVSLSGGVFRERDKVDIYFHLMDFDMP